MHTRRLAMVMGAVLGAGALMVAAQEPQAAPAGQTTDQTQSQAAAGRQGRHKGMDPQKQLKHLTKKLSLSADQQAQILPILTERQQQMQSLRADTSLSQPDRRAKARAMSQDNQSKLEAVLNDQQKQQFEQMLAERKAKHQKHEKNS